MEKKIEKLMSCKENKDILSDWDMSGLDWSSQVFLIEMITKRSWEILQVERAYKSKKLKFVEHVFEKSSSISKFQVFSFAEK